MVNVVTICFVLLTTATFMSAIVLPLSVTDDTSMDNFKERVYESIQELVAEGRIGAEAFSAEDGEPDVPLPAKRRRQGMCYRRGRSGKKMIYIPYRCWKD